MAARGGNGGESAAAWRRLPLDMVRAALERHALRVVDRLCRDLKLDYVLCFSSLLLAMTAAERVWEIPPQLLLLREDYLDLCAALAKPELREGGRLRLVEASEGPGLRMGANVLCGRCIPEGKGGLYGGENEALTALRLYPADRVMEDPHREEKRRTGVLRFRAALGYKAARRDRRRAAGTENGRIAGPAPPVQTACGGREESLIRGLSYLPLLSLENRLDRLLSRSSGAVDEERVVYGAFREAAAVYMPSAMLSPSARLNTAAALFRIPAKSHELLTHIYGDYAQILPPPVQNGATVLVDPVCWADVLGERLFAV